MRPFVTAQNFTMSAELHQAHKLTRPPRILLRMSLVLLLMLAVIVSALILVPWRQTVIGQGEVAVFDPLQRPQNVESQIKGRIVELLVKEGETVARGQILAKLEDRDSKFLNPQQARRLEGQSQALRQKRSATLQRVTALEQQLGAISASRDASITSARAKTGQVRQKREVQRQQLRLGEQDVLTARLQKERIEALNKKGLKSNRDRELAVNKLVEAEAKLQKMQGEMSLLEREIELVGLEIPKLQATAAEKTQKVRESLAKAFESIAEIEQKLEKLANDKQDVEIRQTLRSIEAPRAGRIVNLKKLGVGQLLKEGDVIATIAPEEQGRGVELYLSGLDVPLVETGRPVRLMFEGFPAVPFVGWPWASVGTFAGTVVSVDPVASEGKTDSRYRAWVIPDPAQPAWPPAERLRLGSRTTGWIMLNDVPLYYELWRQLNAFPAQPANGNGGKRKPPKTKPVIRR